MIEVLLGRLSATRSFVRSGEVARLIGTPPDLLIGERFDARPESRPILL